MTRHELYKAMEQEKIIMYDTFFARLERTPLPELMTRWIGILILDREYRIGTHRAEWLATVMWNSAALTVGEAELARRESERQKETERQAKAEQLRKTIKAETCVLASLLQS